MITLTINKKKITAKGGATILDVARENSIFIPTLCHNDSLKPYGSCRICVVEVTQKGKTTLEASCCYPVKSGMIIDTNTRRVREARRVVIELLLSRCQETPEVLGTLAKKYKVGRLSTLAHQGNDNCIRCGLCVRVCSEVVGRGAIEFTGSGFNRTPATPFYERSDECIGCGTCVFVCPTREITLDEFTRDASPIRHIPKWRTEFFLKICKECGNPFFPADSLEKFKSENDFLTPEFFDICPSCRIPPKVDSDLCVACNACIAICPMGAAQFVKEGDDQKSYIYPENCTGCHTCIDLCCWGAIKVER